MEAFSVYIILTTLVNFSLFIIWRKDTWPNILIRICLGALCGYGAILILFELLLKGAA